MDSGALEYFNQFGKAILKNLEAFYFNINSFHSFFEPL